MPLLFIFISPNHYNMRILPFLLLITMFCSAQTPADYVNPFIGTGKSIAKTKWGNYGGTYPGAVCPWGMVQLTPETSIRPGERGYYYEDTEILSFSCVGHKSGFPNGSAGRIHFIFEQKEFDHSNEVAAPGYYSVTFNEGDILETTVTTRTGLFRYIPNKKEFTIGITHAGKITTNDKDEVYSSLFNAIIQFNTLWDHSRQEGDTLFLHFSSFDKEKPLLIKIAVSRTDKEASKRNMIYENPEWDFDGIKEKAFEAWSKELQVVEIPSASNDEKTKFYTALYHSFLIPYVTSDAGDRLSYGDFSFWDTFRSLHPLLTLLKPNVQEDIIHSIEEHYNKYHTLPEGPMTGFHVIPTILDSYEKGITSFDKVNMYNAMKECLSGVNPRYGKAIKVYREKGYLPDTEEHSVNTTLEYAYNDWALSEFAKKIGLKEDAVFFKEQSFNYRNLYDPETQFMLPRNGNTFVKNPGEMGYQESNKWTSTFFVPHNIQDLINLMGGDEAFVSHLEKCYQDGPVIHDNEPVFHYPYLFSYAGRPDLTANKIQYILTNNYFSSPGGITGNDDLGSMSSWYVFSALGLYPVCPGTNQYIITTPSFNKIVIHLPDKKQFFISLKGDKAPYFSELKLNNKDYKKLYITHQDIIKGGHIEYTLSKSINSAREFKRPYSVTTEYPQFSFANTSIKLNKVLPNQENELSFTLTNSGSAGSKKIDILNNGEIIASKRIKLNKGETIHGILPFRLYKSGLNKIEIEGNRYTVSVKKSIKNEPAIVCCSIHSESLIKLGDSIRIAFDCQNISGERITETIPIYIRNQLVGEVICTLDPGERTTLRKTILVHEKGILKIQILELSHIIKIYENAIESTVLYLDFNNKNDSIVSDKSGFGNNGKINGTISWKMHNSDYAIQVQEKAYITLPTSESLMNIGNTVTLSTWIRPTKPLRRYVDFFTKGDYTLMKMEGPETLVFFAGGWGRGACKVKVPDNWYNEWHHVSGVCTGDSLRLYIDSELVQEVAVTGEIEYTEVPWNIGRNAEIPYSRFFEGQFDNLYIFKEPLSSQEIKELYLKDK